MLDAGLIFLWKPWFIINELLSILENVGRMGTELPEFLKRVLSELKNDLDDTDL